MWRVSLIFLLFAVGTVPALAVPHGLAAPYAGANWSALDYPGIAWCTRPHPGLSVEQLAEVPVSGRSVPVAIVMVTCNLNHRYANLYALVPSGDPKRPMLLQRLLLAQGKGHALEPPVALATTADRVTLKVAGFAAGNEGLCCPNTLAVRRWAWSGDRFRELPVIPIKMLVMPSLVGMSWSTAQSLLMSSGILGFDWDQLGSQGAPESKLVVVATTPVAGTVIHLPDLHVTVATSPR